MTDQNSLGSTYLSARIGDQLGQATLSHRGSAETGKMLLLFTFIPLEGRWYMGL